MVAACIGIGGLMILSGFFLWGDKLFKKVILAGIGLVLLGICLSALGLKF